MVVRIILVNEVSAHDAKALTHTWYRFLTLSVASFHYFSYERGWSFFYEGGQWTCRNATGPSFLHIKRV